MDLSSPVQVITGFENYMGNQLECCSEISQSKGMIMPKYDAQINVQNGQELREGITDCQRSRNEACNGASLSTNADDVINREHSPYVMGNSTSHKSYAKESSIISDEREPLSHKEISRASNLKQNPIFLCQSNKYIDAKEVLFLVASNLYYSSLTTYLYSFVLIVNAWVLLTGLFSSRVDATIVIAECFVTFMLILECFLRSLIAGRVYFRSFEGVFDIVITSLCVILLFVSGDLKGLTSSHERAPPEEVEDILRQALTAFRFSIQLTRMITLAMHHKRSELPKEDIDFTHFHQGGTDDL